jgi:hypothetical protein
MFEILKRRPPPAFTLEEKLAVLAGSGLSLAPPFTVQDLLESWPREQYEKPGYAMALVGLGMTEERPPWRNHCVNAWHIDTECIEDEGSYARIAERLAELTQGALVLGSVRDHVDLEAGVANLDFEHAGKAVHLDFEVNDDWVDPAVFTHFVRMLGTSDPTKVFLHYDLQGQDFVIACVDRDQFAALTKAGVNFALLG